MFKHFKTVIIKFQREENKNITKFYGVQETYLRTQ